MSSYKAYLEQSNGCDYTIACGKKLIDLNSLSLEEAKDELIDVLRNYNYPEAMISRVLIIETHKIEEVNTKDIYDYLNKEQEVELLRQQELKELAEFERLKAKFNK